MREIRQKPFVVLVNRGFIVWIGFDDKGFLNRFFIVQVGDNIFGDVVALSNGSSIAAVSDNARRTVGLSDTHFVDGFESVPVGDVVKPGLYLSTVDLKAGFGSAVIEWVDP